MTTKSVTGEAELDVVLAKLKSLEVELAASQAKVMALKTDVRAVKNLIADKRVKTSEKKKVAPAGEPIFETIFYTILVFHILMVLNCRFDKPWIPESEGFCSDLTYLVTKYEFRGTFGRNYDLSAGNFIILIGTKCGVVLSYVESVVNM
uniref:PKcGMP_CC domain-containing protein n=1 Tax=Panagrellus redivivus TaxID=6233 RepID=A0A7E4V625_PANRE